MSDHLTDEQFEQAAELIGNILDAEVARVLAASLMDRVDRVALVLESDFQAAHGRRPEAVAYWDPQIQEQAPDPAVLAQAHDAAMANRERTLTRQIYRQATDRVAAARLALGSWLPTLGRDDEWVARELATVEVTTEGNEHVNGIDGHLHPIVSSILAAHGL